MPKRLLKITNFDRGILLNSSQRDAKEGFYPFAENADSSLLGAVRGVETSENAANSATFTPVKLGRIIADSKEQLLAQKNDTNKSLQIYDGASVQTIGQLGSSSDNATKIIPKDGRAIVACGKTSPAKFVSYINRKQLGTTINGYRVSGNNADPFLNEQGHCFHAQDNLTYEDSDTLTLPTRPLISLLSSTTRYIQRVGNNLTEIPTSGDFSSSKSASLEIEYVEDENDTTPLVFQKGKAYAYAVSIIYDGYQESPLMRTFTQITGGRRNSGTVREKYFATNSLARNAYGIKTQLTVAPTAAMNERITGFNIYRAALSSEDSTPEELFRFVRHISADDTNEAEEWEDGVFGDAFYGAAASRPTPKKITFYDDGFAGSTFEENSGIPETLEQASLNFTDAVEVNEYMFVSGVGPNKYFDSTDGLIFRSVSGSPSTFNLLSEFIQLPEPVIAMLSHESRLYAFSESRTYRINPSGLYIEATLNGFGALSSSHVISTPYGIVQADNSNVYLNNGNNVQPIGDTILTGGYSSHVGYRDITQVNRLALKLGYDPRKGRLVICGRYNGNSIKMWLFDFQNKRWDFSVPTNTDLQNTTIADLEHIGGWLYLVNASGKLIQLFNGSSRERIVLVSYDYTLNSDKGEFWIYKAIIRGQLHSDGNYIQYRFNQGTWIEATKDANSVFSSSGNTHTIKFTGNPKVQSIQFLLGYMQDLDSIHLQFRLPVTDE